MPALLSQPEAHTSLRVSEIKSKRKTKALCGLPWDPHLHQESRAFFRVGCLRRGACSESLDGVMGAQHSSPGPGLRPEWAKMIEAGLPGRTASRLDCYLTAPGTMPSGLEDGGERQERGLDLVARLGRPCLTVSAIERNGCCRPGQVCPVKGGPYREHSPSLCADKARDWAS